MNAKLNHRRTVALTYAEARLLDSRARDEQLTVSALIRKLLVAAVGGEGAKKA